MFERDTRKSTLGLGLTMLQLSFVAAVRQVRQSHRNAVWAIALRVLQTVVFIAAFYLLFTFLGQRTIAVRGDFLLYLLTGIFAYLTHIQAVRAVMGAEGPTSAMMLHAPMNTLVAILSAALSSLYMQTVTLLVLLLFMHTVFNPVVIHDWASAFMMFILAWATGCVVGLLLLAMQPWMPEVTNVIQLIYIRVNMIASGKMFVANMMPSSLIAFFDWNPLFHIIDQARGFVFVNYFPHYSNWQYPLYFTLAMLVIGFMAEAYTRKHASASWSAGR